MTPEQEERYRRGEFDPRYPHDFGPRHVLALLVLSGFGLLVLFL